jgi:hypothetical protein
MPRIAFGVSGKRRKDMNHKKIQSVACGVLALLASCPALFAQVPDLVEGPISPVDAYGNVQPIVRDWRSLGGVYQNTTQRDTLQNYRTFGRGVDDRRGYMPFTLPGDAWAVAMRAASGTSAEPSVRSALSPAKQRAFERYGGFGRRRQNDKPSAALTRRYGLIAGSSLNAPVYRAISKSGGLVDVRSSLTRTPFINGDVEVGEAEAPTLDDLLDRGDAAAQQRVKGEAWALFREGQYRQATRTFESAITLEPLDFESRIGEVFCYLSVGAMRTALALLGELVRRDINPFQHDLRMAERYGNVADVNQLRIQGRRSADTADQTTEANALYIFVLWYLGEREDALRAAESLAKRAPAKAYASWPEKMRAVRSTEGTASGPP